MAENTIVHNSTTQKFCQNNLSIVLILGPTHNNKHKNPLIKNEDIKAHIVKGANFTWNVKVNYVGNELKFEIKNVFMEPRR